jgi:hypothetical protein
MVLRNRYGNPTIVIGLLVGQAYPSHLESRLGKPKAPHLSEKLAASNHLCSLHSKITDEETHLTNSLCKSLTNLFEIYFYSGY